MGRSESFLAIASASGIAETHHVTDLRVLVDVGRRDAGRHVLSARGIVVLDDESGRRPITGIRGKGVRPVDLFMGGLVAFVEFRQVILRQLQANFLSGLESEIL